jgi:hypothetical protein
MDNEQYEPTAFLGATAPVPIDRPFTTHEARAGGASDRQLAGWVADGRLVNPIRGVYHATQLADGLELRLACLRPVVPEDAVITDRTAGWLHGASMILAPNDHQQVPPVSVFRKPGYRLRNGLTRSGERSFLPGEVEELDGLRVTSKLRTACDLGLLLRREPGFAGMDAMARISTFDAGDLVRLGDSRFKGARGVRTFRGTAPYVDGRAQSAPESVMKLRWRDCHNLPTPTPQAPVLGPEGWFYLDLAVPELKYAAEYDGVLWHGPEQQEHDHARRTWLTEAEGWIIDVFTAANIYGPTQDLERRLYAGIAEARRRVGRSGWTGQDRFPA